MPRLFNVAVIYTSRRYPGYMSCWRGLLIITRWDSIGCFEVCYSKEGAARHAAEDRRENR
jgi:hypothetical protein